MTERLIVKPNKNEFLLYAMLDSLGVIRGSENPHEIRKETRNFFKDYKSNLKIPSLFHHSKPVSYVLTLNEFPDFSEKRNLDLDSSMENDVNLSKPILPYLKHFYYNTDFEKFYKNVLPRQKEICSPLQEILDKSKIIDVLDSAWEDNSFSIEVIPMPLEGHYCGIGPSIENTCYSIIGPPFDRESLHLIAHEASHPRAKKILEPIKKEINSKSQLFKYPSNNPNFPESYNTWGICFEEHFIRAMQSGFIDPTLFGGYIEERLNEEKDYNGMVFIKDFYEEIKKYKENPRGSLADVCINILDRIDR
jgi:hypothetical protein